VKSRRAGNHGRELRVWRLVNRPCPWPSPKVCSSPFAFRVDRYRRGEELSPEAVDILLGASPFSVWARESFASGDRARTRKERP
jgi:hypothetical protein